MVTTLIYFNNLHNAGCPPGNSDPALTPLFA